jgi:hypothetical protein
VCCVLPVTDVVLVAASACSSSPPPELSTRSTWSEAVTLRDPDPGVGSRADPDPGVGSRRHVPKDLWPIKAARLGRGNSWPHRPQVRRSPTEESASRLGGSGSGAGASNKRLEIF